MSNIETAGEAYELTSRRFGEARDAVAHLREIGSHVVGEPTKPDAYTAQVEALRPEAVTPPADPTDINAVRSHIELLTRERAA